MDVVVDPLTGLPTFTPSRSTTISGFTGGGGSPSPLTTKGDLYTYSGANTRLPVGTDGYVLSADSSEDTGLKWVVGGGSGGQTYATFVYDTSATPMNNLYNDWSLLMADLVASRATMSGPQTIVFNKPFGDTIPAGTWDLGDTTLTSGLGSSFLYSPIFLDDGCVFTDSWTGKMDTMYLVGISNSPILTNTTALTFGLSLNNAVLVNAGTVPMFELDGIVMSLSLGQLGAVIPPEFTTTFNFTDVSGGGQVNVFALGANCILGDNSFSGTLVQLSYTVGTDSFNSGATPFFPSLTTTFTGYEINPTAKLNKYNTLVSGLTSINVQDAIDEVALRAQVSPPATATDPGQPGWYAYDSSYFYICIATDTWVRTLVLTW